MAGKEDPARNFGAVDGGSAPAEKAEAEAEGIKVGVVPSAFTPQPLPLGRRKQGEKKAGLVYGGLRPCSGSHTPIPTDEEMQQREADFVSGGSLRTFGSRRMLGEKDMGKEVLTGGKRKAEGSEGEGGKPAAAAVTDEMAEAAGAGAGAGDAKAAEIKWVEMPLEYIAWLLSQKREDYSVRTLEDYTLHRSINSGSSTAADFLYTQEELDEHRELVLKVQATDEAGREEFMAFQEWVRETFERNGCVMVPESFGFDGPNPGGIQDVIDEEWEKGKHLLEMVDLYPSSNREEGTGVAMPSD